MKTKLLFIIFLLLNFSGNAITNYPTIRCIQIDPLSKVLPEQTFFVENNTPIDLAKGETASFQFVIRSTQNIQNLKIEASPLQYETTKIPLGFSAFVGYVKVGRDTPNPSNNKLISPSGFYPDPLLEVESVNVPFLTNQPVWCSYKIPEMITPGIYKASIKFTGELEGKKFEIIKNISTEIHNVELPEQKLWITNWFSTTDDKLKLLNNGNPVTIYSTQYWDIMKLLANKMRDYSQNVYLISPLQLCDFNLNGTQYTFDFSNFDKMVELFIKEGNLKRIEGGHLGGRIGNWDSKMSILVPVQGKRFEMKKMLINNDTAQTFIRQFIPALYLHLKEKGWNKIYWQHIADEPIKSNVKSYIDIAELVKSLAPEAELIEANHSRDVENTIHVWVPQLNFFHTDYQFYQERKSKGDEIWFYTCLGPQGNYANRFLEQPLIQTRLLHWINFRYGATGYLHWGLNYWNENPYHETTGINEEGGNILPGGDSWIIYPSHNKLFSSIRFEAMRDGIADYGLLEALAKKYPDKTAELVRTTIYQFNLYDNNIDAFRNKRREILNLLSK